MRLYPMKRILVCTDLSESSDQVLKAAEELRRRNGGSIDLLYVSELGLHFEDVLNDSLKATYRDVFLGNLKTTFESKMREQINRCGVSGREFIREGKVYEVILETANEGKHDLIVMGHGQKSLVHNILGSNASKVISGTPLPLFIVKKPAQFGKVAGLVDESRPMDRVIIGTLDFFHHFQYKEIEFISLWMDFPEPFGNEGGKYNVEAKLKEEVQYFADKGEKVIIKAEPTKELKLAYPIVKILTDDKVDVVVLKRFSEGNLKRVYIGSTTKRLLEIFEGNLMIIPP